MPETPHLSVRCDARVGALRVEVDFRLEQGWTVLFGPSGSGKSSILRLIAGLWTPRGASVRMAAEDLTATPPHLRRIVLVAQQPALFPHMNVAENVGFACGGAQQQVDAALALFDLRDFRSARVTDLSGGERQRVALARAVAADPRMLLLDEVFSGMHRGQRDDLLGRVKSHCAGKRVPVLSVTHDVAEAYASADEVLRLQAGRMAAQGPASSVLADERTSLLRRLQATNGTL